MKREADFQTTFRHWIRANPYRRNAAFELKQTTTDSIPFSAVSDHQLIALRVAKGGSGLLYKIPDDSRGFKPFDMVYFRNADALVVIKYPNFFCMIDIDRFIKESEISKRRSLTADRAKCISIIVVDL